MTNKYPLNDVLIPDDSLLTSEILLAHIPRKRFQVDSWQIFDPFMSYAVDNFSMSLAGLIKNGYLIVADKRSNQNNILGYPIARKIDYGIRIQKIPPKGQVVGWLEEKILDQYTPVETYSLKELAYRVFNDILNENHDYSNPGKIFIIELCKNQKLNHFEYHQKKKWLSNCFTVQPNPNTSNQYKRHTGKLDYNDIEEIELPAMRKIIRKQLGKFQILD
ncbi:hypothetical protein KJS94_10510 [Flavihumibacter rivuli]|uniref:hypothetical protein n=1 Tax=Flavihumibacter rivuli TaxID=2838156 RepID=UPI001BDEB91C|nr:hypothetical protein [Flavihumibacter rivuli]ULQ55071.1 hypothetical protein KJS94_10510 [Flavihumibacter rivuli]